MQKQNNTKVYYTPIQMKFPLGFEKIIKIDDAFITKLQESEFVQSMSAKGCCWDNAPQESFFGHMKDEIKAEVSKCRSFREVQELLEDWMDYYNHDRYQWDLLKLSPAEFYEYLQTGVYPLPKWSKK